MCGIAGIISRDSSVASLPILKLMTQAIAHRGPDGEGYWLNNNNTAGFGHRRLSIIDLSLQASQPMHFLNRYTIVYNGEIYNYVEIRNELRKAGYDFVSASDTEVILAAYDCYKEMCLQYFDGMFAFAIWDEHEKTLFAARDRFGEKPFYYWTDDVSFFFGSEMKALWAAGKSKSIDEKMLMNYLALGYVQNPADKSQTFYKEITALPPAHYILLRQESCTFTLHHYWDIDKQIMKRPSVESAVKEMDELLSDSIIKRLRSDVPVGISLSGGVDSSTIAWYINRSLKASGNDKTFKSFSAVFPGFAKDESEHIHSLKESLRLENYQVTPNAQGLISEFEKLAHHQEEPFPSTSIYAQYKVFALAKQNGIKVLLDGQGADETMAGYQKYAHWYLQEMISRNKFSLAKKERRLLHKNKVDFRWDVKNLLAAFLPSHASIALEQKEYKKILHNPDLSKSILAHLKGREWEGIHKPIVTKLNDILYFNTMKYGLEELLRYADRNSMAHGIEIRLPFLQGNFVEFIFSLPSAYKIHEGYPKWILRKLMEKRIPSEIVWRTDKVGYEPPQKMWMEDLLMKDYIYEARKKLVEEHILKPSVLQKKIAGLDAHAADNFDWRYVCVAQIMSK
jgi:asparagine synthase (glutamine-hydrolysing)